MVMGAPTPWLVTEPTALTVLTKEVCTVMELQMEESVAGDYTYLWDDGAGQTTPTATGLAAGSLYGNNNR